MFPGDLSVNTVGFSAVCKANEKKLCLLYLNILFIIRFYFVVIIKMDIKNFYQYLMEVFMTNSEVDKLIKKYFLNNPITVNYSGDSADVERIVEIFPNKFYDDIRPDNIKDAPDLYIREGNTVYIIEHFEFDCYKRNNRKGSSYQRENARIEAKIDSVKPTESGVQTHDIIDAESSYEFYVENVSFLFDKHYHHISMYIDNLKKLGIIEKGDVVKIMFLIEDVSPLGTMAYKRGEGYSGQRYAVDLAHSKEFLELLQSRKDVDYIIAFSSDGQENNIWFINNSEIEKYIDESLDYDQMQFLNWKPHVMSYQVLVPNKKSDSDI